MSENLGSLRYFPALGGGGGGGGGGVGHTEEIQKQKGLYGAKFAIGCRFTIVNEQQYLCTYPENIDLSIA